jgi:acyl carrier protein
MRELLHADAEVAAWLADDGIRAALVDVVGEVLRIDGSSVNGAELRDLPNYNSLRLVEIVERAEDRLGVRLDDTDLTPQALRDVDSLCAAFERRVRESR